MIWADVDITVVSSGKRPLKSGERVRLLLGTVEATGRIFLPDRDLLFPGESAGAQFAFDTSLTEFQKGSFVICPYSSQHNIGNGRILGIHVPKPGLKEKQHIKVRLIEERLLANPYQPLKWSLISKELFFFTPEEGEEIRKYLEEKGIIVNIDEDLFFHRNALASAKELISGYIESKGSITPGQARDLLGSSRKFVIPLLEYFDAQGITVRNGNKRELP